MEINDVFFKKFIKNLGNFLGEKCEIVVHDYRNGFEHTITDIANNEVTGRNVGGCPSSAFIEKLENGGEEIERNPIYFIKHTKGKIIKCCSTLIRDADNNVIGAVCVNFDVSDFILSQNTVASFVKYTPEVMEAGEDDILVKSVDELMDYYMGMAEKTVGKPMSLMDKDEKIKALRYLDSKGVFKIAKANVSLSEALQISKYTLYSYLEEGRNTDHQS
ncbi:hypothetical protein FACS1894187_12120 [Synergistales bacterium]|nr:hypothetical protein FACS1894187_12120 [Synergistales bacterium]